MPNTYVGENGRFVVALNFAGERVPLDPREPVASRARVELSTDPAREPGEVDPASLVLEADEGLILRVAG